jgi:predicted nucleic acid-binding protein
MDGAQERQGWHSHAERGNDRTLMSQYSDLPMDLADASLVVLDEYLGHGRILSYDVEDRRIIQWIK